MDSQASEGIRARMASGAWFEAADIGLESDRLRARAVMRRFNSDLSLTEEEREGLVKGLFGSIGEDSALSTGAQVDYGYNVFIGDRCFFNFNCTFLDGAPIRFGDDVWVGPAASFVTPLHPLLAEERNMRIDADGTPHLWERNEPITVGNGVWIAGGVTVCPGVAIGDGAVIGAGSVVTEDVAPRVFAAGTPCRAIRGITEADAITAEMPG